MLLLFIALAFLVGTVVGFFLVAMRIDHKPSGILHIKTTDEKDYYTIEITDDLSDIPKKKEILLLVKTSRENHVL